MRIPPERVGFDQTRVDSTEIPTRRADELVIDDVGDNMEPRARISWHLRNDGISC